MNPKALLLAGALFAVTWTTANADTTPGAAVDDSLITTKIKSSLVADPDTKAREIKVKTHDGVVSLSGRVDSDAAKQRAEQIASETQGVNNVQNFLIVRTSSTTVGQKLDDSALTAKVKAALVNDPTTKAREIKVNTMRDVVQLSGFVGTESEKMEAARVAASVSGVKDVHNNLLVKSE